MTPTIVARGHRAGSEPRSAPARQRWYLPVGVAAALVLAIVVLALTQDRTSALPLAPDNPAPEGARAVAQILSEHGVQVQLVTSTEAAITEAEAGTTLLILDPGGLRQEQQSALADVDADTVVLADITGGSLSALTDRVRIEAYVGTEERAAGCSDEHAQAAETITAGGATVSGTDVTTCFADSDSGGLYATWTEDGQRWRVLSDGAMLSNAALATSGHAALVLRSLGEHERVIWYLPDPNDQYGLDEETVDLLPVSRAVIVQLLLVGLVLVLWRGRRLGPVVVEPLPVTVKAAETTRGRGRLYRKSRAHAHAAAALRAGFIARVAGRLGLPSHASPDQVVSTLAGASGRDPAAIHDVLYSASPTTDEDLMTLTQALDILESEVQHR